MTILQLRMEKNLEGLTAFAMGEVTAADGRVVFHGRIPVGYAAKPLDVIVDPGEYLVRIQAPSGEVITEPCTVSGERQPLHIRGRYSAHEWLSWHEFSIGKGTDGQAVPLGTGSGMSGPPSMKLDERLRQSQQAPQLLIGTRKGLLAPATLSLERPQLQEIRVGGLVLDVKVESDERFLLLRITQRGGGPFWRDPQEWPRVYLGASAPGAPFKTAALPLPWPDLSGNHEQHAVEVLLETDPQYQSAPTERTTPFASLLVRDPKFGPLLSFLAAGNPASARDVAEELYSDAESMLWAKMTNPYAAAAGGYVLLRTLRSDNLPNWYEWPQNLMRRFLWLPDGAVISGWQHLMRGFEGLARARDCFVEAVTRGVPVYSEGVRLLRLGLTILAQEQRFNDDRFGEALTLARWLNATIDPDMPFSAMREPRPEVLWGGRTPLPMMPSAPAAKQEEVQAVTAYFQAGAG